MVLRSSGRSFCKNSICCLKVRERMGSSKSHHGFNAFETNIEQFSPRLIIQVLYLVKWVCASSLQTLFSLAMVFMVTQASPARSTSFGSDSRSRISRTHSSGSELTNPVQDSCFNFGRFDLSQLVQELIHSFGPGRTSNGVNLTHESVRPWL